MSHLRPSLCISWRVGIPYWEPDEAFARLLEEVKRYPTISEEVALFDTVTHHLYIPLESYSQRMWTAARRIHALRDAGVGSVGINVLCTMGHINEGWDYMPPLPFQPMVGHDGSVSFGCGCPNSAGLREYVAEKYRLVAQAGPDFVWVDDDIRMNNHGVAYACFCDVCLGMFGQGLGEEFSREDLVVALNDPAQPDVREAWVEFNCTTVESLMADVAEAIHGVNPQIATGLMTAGPDGNTYSGQDFPRWFGALRATKARPGGGWYTDEPRMGVIQKALDCGRQRVSLPCAVTDCQYELEQFPYQLLRKAPRSVANECTLALANGLNGVAINALSMWATNPEDHRPVLDEIARHRPMWERYVEWSAGLPTLGLWPAWNWETAARRRLQTGEDWFGGSAWQMIGPMNVLAEIGIPLSVDRPGQATVLYGRLTDAFTDDELQAMLTGGVLMDSTALLALWERGLGELTGVRVGRRLTNGLMETFTEDALNGPYAGEIRDARIEFWHDPRGTGDEIEPVSGGVRVLAHLADYFRRPAGPCMTACENDLGGRVVVMGYAPWMFLQSVAKRAQLQNVADWVSGAGMPVRVAEPVPAVPFVRMSDDRERGALVVLNTGLQELGTITVQVRGPRVTAIQVSPDGAAQGLPTEATDGGWELRLRDVEAWGLRCVLMGEGVTG